MGFTFKKGSEKGGVSRRCLERPLVEYAPLGVRPNETLGTPPGPQLSGKCSPVSQTEKIVPVLRVSFWKGVEERLLRSSAFLRVLASSAFQEGNLLEPPLQKDTLWTGTVFFHLSVGNLPETTGESTGGAQGASD